MGFVVVGVLGSGHTNRSLLRHQFKCGLRLRGLTKLKIACSWHCLLDGFLLALFFILWTYAMGFCPSSNANCEFWWTPPQPLYVACLAYKMYWQNLWAKRWCRSFFFHICGFPHHKSWDLRENRELAALGDVLVSLTFEKYECSCAWWICPSINTACPLLWHCWITWAGGCVGYWVACIKLCFKPNCWAVWGREGSVIWSVAWKLWGPSHSHLVPVPEPLMHSVPW